MEKTINVGISSCLLGQKVRYDGQHKRDAFLADNLAAWCRFVPVCPEVECGLPVPREAMRLVGDPSSPRLMTQRSKKDHTDRMMSWSRRRCEELGREDLSAFVFKTKSPSSGLGRVRVYNEKGGVVSRDGRGLFARVFTDTFPDLPVIDEGRLNDPVLRENFVETLLVLNRWRQTRDEGSPGALVDFHSRHKYTFMARSQKLLRLMGPVLSDLSGENRDKAVEAYHPLLLGILREKKDPANIVNVLMHMAGYFRKEADPLDRKELNRVVEEYAKGHLPLLVPLTLINHFSRKYGQEYLLKQYFLNPHPLEMKLLYPF